MYSTATNEQNVCDVSWTQESFFPSETTLKLYCNAVGIDFQDSMLKWKTLTPEDKKEWEELSDWFQVVLNSAGFLTKSPSKYPDLSELPDDVQKSVEENIPFYQQMYEKRLRP